MKSEYPKKRRCAVYTSLCLVTCFCDHITQVWPDSTAILLLELEGAKLPPNPILVVLTGTPTFRKPFNQEPLLGQIILNSPTPAFIKLS
jgi:hypothetical protein